MNSNPAQSKTVFISYAREDTEVANRLYNDIKIAGLDPWLDTQSLLPGQNWRIAIKDAIKNSDYFIPLLSSNSVQKRGYVQAEFKYGIEVLKETPPDDIRVIPVRMDECEIPYEELRKYTYQDLFPDWAGGIQKILKSMGVEKISPEITNDLQDYLISKDDEWTELLQYIYEKKCTPFVGSEAHVRWIPSDRNIAVKWTEDFGYPFEDSYQLPQVAQYLAIKEDDEMSPKNLLSNILKKISPPNFSLSEYQNTLYVVLADLNLPLYITTNYDHLMEEALKSRGKDPKSEFCRWNDNITQYANRAGIRSVFEDKRYNPTPARPLVYHLHGDMDNPRSMVLTEKDYVDFVINMGKWDKNPILPTLVQTSFATSSQLFVGYRLKDMNSRIIFRSIANFLAAIEPPLSLAVVSPSMNISNKNKDAQKYLNGYAKDMFKLNIYWSDPFLFSIELRKRFNSFKKERSTSI